MVVQHNQHNQAAAATRIPHYLSLAAAEVLEVVRTMLDVVVEAVETLDSSAVLYLDAVSMRMRKMDTWMSAFWAAAVGERRGCCSCRLWL